MERLVQDGFGERLRAERERLGYTQSDFAELAGVKRVTQYLYETEEGVPNLRYLKAISDAGGDVHYLLFSTRSGETRLSLSPAVLEKLFRVVDELGRDKKGKPLALDSRVHMFKLLVAAYEDRDVSEIKDDVIRSVIAA
ncbi:helix-turn-helix domain-containing protein [Petrachloros mirabilis]